MSLSVQQANQTLRSVCVTGTNGKTSATIMVAAVVAAAGEATATMTTLGNQVDGQSVLAGEQTAFVETLRLAMDHQVKTIAIETTSRALALGFAEFWSTDVAVFTNLSHDHLDYHPSLEHYLAAKSQLFQKMKPEGTAVLNCADEASSLIDEVTPTTVQRMGYCAGTVATECRQIPLALKAKSISMDRYGTRVTFEDSPLSEQLGGGFQIQLLGEVFAENAMAALLATHALGYSPNQILAGLRKIERISGRFEIVERAPLTVVDYAHTPDALRRTLYQAQKLLMQGTRKLGRVICVFGCGGEKDPSKRSAMGRIAGELAQVVIVTTDNPRKESAQHISSSILAEARLTSAHVMEEADRKRAIEIAMNIAAPSDVIVIAGKGHETTQVIGEQIFEFSDQDAARRAFACRTTEKETT